MKSQKIINILIILILISLLILTIGLSVVVFKREFMTDSSTNSAPSPTPTVFITPTAQPTIQPTTKPFVNINSNNLKEVISKSAEAFDPSIVLYKKYDVITTKTNIDFRISNTSNNSYLDYKKPFTKETWSNPTSYKKVETQKDFLIAFTVKTPSQEVSYISTTQNTSAKQTLNKTFPVAVAPKSNNTLPSPDDELNSLINATKSTTSKLTVETCTAHNGINTCQVLLNYEEKQNNTLVKYTEKYTIDVYADYKIIVKKIEHFDTGNTLLYHMTLIEHTYVTYTKDLYEFAYLKVAYPKNFK